MGTPSEITSDHERAADPYRGRRASSCCPDRGWNGRRHKKPPQKAQGGISQQGERLPFHRGAATSILTINHQPCQCPNSPFLPDRLRARSKRSSVARKRADHPELVFDRPTKRGHQRALWGMFPAPTWPAFPKSIRRQPRAAVASFEENRSSGGDGQKKLARPRKLWPEFGKADRALEGQAESA